MREEGEREGGKAGPFGELELGRNVKGQRERRKRVSDLEGSFLLPP